MHLQWLPTYASDGFGHCADNPQISPVFVASVVQILTSGNSVHKGELVSNPFFVVDILVTELPKCLTLARQKIGHNSEQTCAALSDMYNVFLHLQSYTLDASFYSTFSTLPMLYSTFHIFICQITMGHGVTRTWLSGLSSCVYGQIMPGVQHLVKQAT